MNYRGSGAFVRNSNLPQLGSGTGPPSHRRAHTAEPWSRLWLWFPHEGVNPLPGPRAVAAVRASEERGKEITALPRRLVRKKAGKGEEGVLTGGRLVTPDLGRVLMSPGAA